MELFWSEEPRSSYIAFGKVRSVTGKKVNVSIKGSDATPLPKLASYSPTAGDVVLVAMMPSGGVVLGAIG